MWRKALRRLDAAADVDSTAPVPLDRSVPAYRVCAVMIGVAFTLTGLYTGSELAMNLGLAVGIRAAILGSIVLTVMSVPAAMVGARTRLSTYMIVAHVFGKGGAKLVNCVLAIVLLGWYAVTAELFGRTFYLTAAEYLPANAPEWVYTIASSALVVATTVFGFRAINRLSLAAAPLLISLTVYVAYRALAHRPWSVLLAIQGNHLDSSTGVSAVIGGWIVSVVLMPDITRYSRSTFECAVISLVGNGVGAAGALILAMIPALAFGEIDPVKYMAVLGLVGVAFITLVASTWTVNAINLYSTGLVSSAVVQRVSYGRLVIWAGVIGTACALARVADRLIDFLVLLGLVVPPIAAVYLTDFFVLRHQNYSDTSESAKNNVNGIAACAAGATVGITMYYTNTSFTGVPTIEAFLSGGLVYWLAECVRSASHRDRTWRPVG
ncbi:MAG: cytosine permease [Proteobacteria bacterium]|nr:cytosine permease [Pseudomonadota bacterium]